MSKMHLLDEKAESLFGDESRSLYRYMGCKYIGDLNKLVFSNPFNPKVWDDPFERWYLEATYRLGNKEFEYKFKDRVLCLCFTTTNHNEALWKVSKEKENKKCDRVKLRYDTLELKRILEAQDKYDVYAGCIKYLSHSDFERNTPARSLRVGKEAFINDITWIKLLFLKRDAFKYENEFRIVLISKERNDVSTDHIPIPVNCNNGNLVFEASLLTGVKYDSEQDIKNKLNAVGIKTINYENLYEVSKENRFWNLNRIRIQDSE